MQCAGTFAHVKHCQYSVCLNQLAI